MLESSNKLYLLGVLNDDLEEKESKSGYTIVKLFVKTREARKLKQANREGGNGGWSYEDEVHEVILFGETAQHALRNLTKGSKIFIEGRIKTNEYEAKSGKMYTNAQIICQKFINLSDRSEFENNCDKQKVFQDDEIPF